MLFWLNKATAENKAELKNYLNQFETTKKIHFLEPKDGRIFSPYILRNSTHFITSREMISLECMDWLWDTDVKIVSALDDAIFDGEPDVNWNKIFVH